jgi:polysaccharide biosynthesis/export protein
VKTIAPFLLLLVLAACAETPAGTGQIPADLAAQSRVSAPPLQDYRLAPGDQLEFRVVNLKDMDTVQQIRGDGRITLPLIEDQVVAGKTLQELRDSLRREYVQKNYLTASAAGGINLIIKESAGNRFYVGGQVKKAGMFTYSHPTTVTRSLFEAGGIEATADPTKVLLIRQDGSYQVVNVKRVLAGNLQDDVQLRPMDTVYVPTSTIGDINTFVQLYIKNVLPVTPGLFYGF